MLERLGTVLACSDGVKIDPKSHKMKFSLASVSYIIFDRFWHLTGTLRTEKNKPALQGDLYFSKIAFRCQHCFFLTIWNQLASIFPPKIHQHRKFQPQRLQVIHRFWHQFWCDFVSKLVPSWTPSWAYVGANVACRGCSTCLPESHKQVFILQQTPSHTLQLDFTIQKHRRFARFVSSQTLCMNMHRSTLVLRGCLRIQPLQKTTIMVNILHAFEIHCNDISK